MKKTMTLLALLLNISFMNMAYSQSEGTVSYIEIAHPTFESKETSYIEILEPTFDCNVSDSYSYLTIGVGPVVFAPNFGVGYRVRDVRLGWDAAVSFSTIGYAHQLNAHVVGHYYLNPMQKNSAYLGLGLMGSGVFTNRHGSEGGTLSADFVIGKEFETGDKSHQFLEMHVDVPTLCMNSKHTRALYLPLVYIKYGISF